MVNRTNFVLEWCPNQWSSQWSSTVPSVTEGRLSQLPTQYHSSREQRPTPGKTEISGCRTHGKFGNIRDKSVVTLSVPRESAHPMLKHQRPQDLEHGVCMDLFGSPYISEPRRPPCHLQPPSCRESPSTCGWKALCLSCLRRMKFRVQVGFLYGIVVMVVGKYPILGCLQLYGNNFQSKLPEPWSNILI